MFFAQTVLKNEVGTPLTDVKFKEGYRKLDLEGRQGMHDYGCLIAFLVTVGIGLILLIVVCAVGKPGDMMTVNTNANSISAATESGEISSLKIEIELGSESESIISQINANSTDDTDDPYKYSQQIVTGYVNKIIGDFVKHLWMVFVLVIIGFALGVSYILLLKYFVKPLVWFSIIAGVTFLYLITLVFIIVGIVLALQKNDAFMIIGIVLIVVGVVFLIISLIVTAVVYFARDKMKLDIQLLKEACNAMRAMPLLPLVTGALNVVEIICMGFFLLYIIFGMSMKNICYCW